MACKRQILWRYSLTVGLLLLGTTCHTVQINDLDDAGTYEWILNEYYSGGIVNVPKLDVPQLIAGLQSHGLTMPEIRDMLRGYGLAVHNVALEYGKPETIVAIGQRWKLPAAVMDCLASPTSPVSTAVKPAWFVAGKTATPRFIECYENDIEKVSRALKAASPKSVILALDYRWKSIETLEYMQLYADRLHSIILLWGVHNAIDQTDFTEAAEIYDQLYRVVKCINPAIFIWKQVCLVTAEDGIFRWLEAVDGPCDGFMVWGPYQLPEQGFADNSFKLWQEHLLGDKPIALGSLFNDTGKGPAYAQKAGYVGVIRQDAALPTQWVDSPKVVVPEPEPTRPEPSRWDN